MRSIHVFLFTALFAATVGATVQFERYGSWSNTETTGSENTEYHATGFDLELFRYNGKFVGYLSEYVNEPYDPPIGRLDNLKVDEKTGDISFETKMSLYIEGPTSVRNSKNLYRFKGRIAEQDIRGAIESINPQTRKIESTKEIVLVGGRGGDVPKNQKGQEMTYEEWQQFQEKLMKVRGPKW